MKDSTKFRISTVEFTHFIKGKVTFDIINNLPDMKGLSLEDAVNNWVARTQKFTAASLCNYINSKGTDHIAFTSETEYNKLKNRRNA